MTRKVELNILIGKSWFTTILSLWSAQMAAVFVQCIRIITEVVKEFIIQASTFYIVIIQYKTVKVDGVNIFFRQAENMKKATILLLHGFPSSSHMFRNLIKELADEYNIIAPDYPGFGNSDQPPIDEFEYTFDNLANVINNFVEGIKLDKYSIYVHDYGAPVGFRLAVKHPERIQSIITQNGNAYEEGLLPYQNNLKQYAIWQQYFRTYSPPTLVAWGKNDIFFGTQGALAFQKDIKDVEVHLLNTGHFPLEEDLDVSVTLIKRFLSERIIF